jgi:hypothetical protein
LGTQQGTSFAFGTTPTKSTPPRAKGTAAPFDHIAAENEAIRMLSHPMVRQKVAPDQLRNKMTESRESVQKAKRSQKHDQLRGRVPSSGSSVNSGQVPASGSSVTSVTSVTVNTVTYQSESDVESDESSVQSALSSDLDSRLDTLIRELPLDSQYKDPNAGDEDHAY